MNAVMTYRDPDIIAAEINHIVDHTRIIVLTNTIEIGRRLCEAKETVPHGQWGQWLQEKVDFSTSTANNFMRLFEEYANDQMALFGETTLKNQAFGNLTYTKALALLDIPGEEREEFVKENDVDAMSTRDLKKAIKERDKAQKDLAKVSAGYTKAAEENAQLKEALENEREEASRKITELTSSMTELNKKLEAALANDDQKEIESLKQDLAEADGLLKSANDEIDELNKKLSAKPIDIPATTIIEKSSDAIKVSVLSDTLGKNFQLILEALGNIQDEEERAKYQKALKALLYKMSERL